MMKLQYRLFAHTTFVVGLLTILAGAAAGGEAPRAILPVERQVLIDLYTSTNGAGWTQRTNWRNADDTDFNAPGTECSWFGVGCNGEGTRVVSVNLSWSNLTGTLPASLADLLSPLDLQLQGNQIAGAIPPQLGSLASLQVLVLHSNLLSGSIPPELASLSNLTNLRLDDNLLSGPIPTGFGNLSQLDNLELQFNQLSGEIPASLGNLSKLITLGLNDNLLSGTIPSTLGNLSSLDYLSLGGNDLSGEIPESLGGLSRLTRLELYDNKLTGSIPAALGNLTSLQSLKLSANQLAGPLPSGLGNLGALTTMLLDGNQLSGSIPASFGGLTAITNLSLGQNHLGGAIPPELGSLENLTHLELKRNALIGNIPAQLGNLAKLEVLRLDYNQLTGHIPAALGGLSKLKYLDLSNNQLTGPLPSELGSLGALTAMVLSWNQLAGSIPPSFGGLTALTYLSLAQNHLGGEIPAEIGALTGLDTLWLAGNAFRGPVPPSLMNLAGLVVGRLNLLDNALHTDDPNLRAFLNSKQMGGDFENVQTVPPANLAPGAPTLTSLHLSWTPIPYWFGSGRYVVWGRPIGSGPYRPMGETADRAATGLTVLGLDPATPYELVVLSVSEPHLWNSNSLRSDPGAPVLATTTGVVSPSGAPADLYPGSGTVSNLNGVFEPGETAIVAPAWTNRDVTSHLEYGTAAASSTPGGFTFTVHDGTASYGTIGAGSTVNCHDASGDCYMIEVSVPEARPALHWDLQWVETQSTGEVKTWHLHLGDSFFDAGPSSWAYGFIETLLHNGVTTGCDPANRLFCPGGVVTRDQMAVFLSRAMAGGDDYVQVNGVVPGKGAYDCTDGGASLFADIAPTDWFCRHAHAILAAGVTTGCDPVAGLYCPSPAVSREIMAVFVARAMAGGDANVPMALSDPSGRAYDCNPAAENTFFTDVQASAWTCRHVHYLWATGVIAGCDSANHLYCPAPPVTRDQMAKFLTNGFALTLY